MNYLKTTFFQDSPQTDGMTNEPKTGKKKANKQKVRYIYQFIEPF